MTRIEELLELILDAVYGVDVRQSIHDAIAQCYYDSKVGSLDLIARQQIATLVAANNDTDGNSELIDVRTGADAKTYESAGEAVRQQFTDVKASLADVIKELSDIRIGTDETEYDSAGEAIRVQLAEILSIVENISTDNTKDFATVEFDNSERLLHFYDEYGVDVYEPVYIEDSNGSQSGAGTVIRLTNQNGVSVLAGSYGNALNLMFTFTSTEDDLPTGNGSCKITVNGVPKVNMNIPQGLTVIDVSPYLSIGANTVIVTCTDVYGKSRSLSYTITIVKLSIESTFDATVPYTDDILFKYTPYGAVEKTIHFVVDGKEIGTVVTSLSGKQMTRNIPKMSHGAHKFEVYSTASLDGTDIESPKQAYDIICLEEGITTPIIASVYGKETITQGEQVSIPYIIYDPTKLACDISLTVYTLENGSEVVYSNQDITVDRSQWTWNTRKYPIGTVYFRIKYGDISKTHTIDVEESKIVINPETNDLELYLASEGRSNNEVNPANWAYGDITTTFSDCNWSSVGWVGDELGDTCLRLNGEARAEINFKPFAEDLRVYGKTIELEFAIRDVNNRDAVVISCMSGGIGFEVKADTAYIVSEQSRVFCNYKEEERVKVAFVIESRSEYRLLSIYLNGVLSDTIQYPSSDNFQQSEPVNITIGSSDCGIDVYKIRSYTTALTDSVLTTNYIADMTDITKKTAVYEDNDIYDDYGNISYPKAKAKNSVMVIVGNLPQSKGDKKDVVVHYYDVENANLNFVDEDVEIDVQGTSSQWYVRKNWKLKCSAEHLIDADQLPNKVFCIKVDYAEATGTHNTQNANFIHKLYDEAVPPQATNSKIRTTIYGKPILLFHQATATSDPVFYGKANFNYDKGSEAVFGFTNAYDVESWEFCNNTSDACNFLGPIPSNWSEDFEARYPDKYKNISRFKVMHDWVVSTKGNVEKFKAEFENYFDLHYSLVYYVYTFFALMVDQRAKNMFLTYWGTTGKWYPYFYDNDTCFGINNEGQLVFDYYHEDTDQLEGANVYNGQNSTLWCNFREAFAEEIKETYQDLRSNGVLNYDELVEQFITNGSDKWSESVYNEDGDFKYISMLRTDNDASNLPQVRGTGEEHFRYFIENRLNYCDSKWYATDYANDYISLRIYTPETWSGVAPNADITITPYSHIYAGVRYKANGNLYQQRIEANEEITFEAPDETFNDTETAVYDASRISSLGDLSPLYCGSVNVSKATKLTELQVGSGVTGYSNPNLKELSVGTNKLLRKIDVRNCPNFTGALGLAGCPNIEEVYATGTSITGVEFAESGCLRIAHLPETIANLTLKDQVHIEEIALDGYDALKTLWVENCPTLDTLDILSYSPNIERARLTKVNWTYSTASSLLALINRNLAGIDETGTNTDTMWVDGTCHIRTLSGADYNRIKAAFPYLKITYNTLTSQLVFMSEDGETELTRQTITNAGDGACPVTNGTITTTPTKESTAQYDFTFGGWSTVSGGDPEEDALLKVEGDRIVYVAFDKAIRSYTVKFYNDTTLLETLTVEYGSDAVYSGETPVKNVSNSEDFEFSGWYPAPTNIQGNTNCYAQYYDLREITDSWETIAANVANGTATSLYAIGAFKPVEIANADGSTETIEVEVVAHNHDELAEGTPSWESVTTLPNGGNNNQAVVYKNKIHYFMLTNHYTWDGVELVKMDSTPINMDLSNAIVYNNELHILGGNASPTAHYKWDGSTWSEVSVLPYNFKHQGRAVIYNNELHILGGGDDTERVNHYKWTGSEWVSASTLPEGAYKFPCVVYNNEIHYIHQTNHYKWNGSEWTTLPDTPYNLLASSAAVYDGAIHFLGTNTSGYQNAHYKWDGSEWSSVDTLPMNFINGTSAVFRGKLHLISGQYSKTAFYAYRNTRASLTFLTKNTTTVTKPFSTVNYNDRTANAWYHSTLRTWCNGELFSSFPEDLQNVIKDVVKLSNSDDANGNMLIWSSVDKVWIPSYEELGLDNSDSRYMGLGEPYSVFTDDASRVRKTYAGTDPMSRGYRVRNKNTFQNVYYIWTNGSFTTGALMTSESIVVFGFCI